MISNTNEHPVNQDGDFECDAPEDYAPAHDPELPAEDRLQSDEIEEPPVSAQLPLPADGLFGYYDPARKFGIQAAVDALLEAGRIWRARNKLPAVGIGDISKQGGGQISGHASHRKGVDVDIRPLMKNGQVGPATYRDPTYSFDLSQEWVDILHANGKLAVKLIFFNDPKTQSVTPYPHHDNHFHVRFYLPGERQALPTLSQGFVHPAVRDAQRRWNFWIAAERPVGVAELVVDGEFGNATREAVRAFQGARGLSVDGRITRGGVWEGLPIAPLSTGNGIG